MNTQFNTNDFNQKGVIQQLDQAQIYFKSTGDIPVENLCYFLEEFCKIFKQMSRLMGIAFSDIQEKVIIIRQRAFEYQQSKGLFDIISIEISKGIIEMNGDNNKGINKLQEYKNYISCGRTILRMMRFMNYLKSMFQQILNNRQISIKEVCYNSYMETLYPYHTWLVQTAAKAAMQAAPDRTRVLNLFMGLSNPLIENEAYDAIQQFLLVLEPINNNLWNYYESNKLNNLP